jgi:hypothetical protein
MTSQKYKPDSRPIDDPEKLRKLYQKDGLSIREIAKEHASVGRTSVHSALQEAGITGADESNPSADSVSDESVNWVQLTD